MPTQRVPLVGSLTDRKVNASLTDSTDQKFINCFPEIVENELTGRTTVYLNKRQGTVASADVQASASGQFGTVVWSSNASAGAVDAPVVLSFRKSTGTSVMFFDAATQSQIGSDVANTSRCLYMDETDVSGTGNLTATLTDSSTSALEAWYFPAGGAWTQITDGDFPSSIMPTHAHMDGYMFVMTETAQIYNSDLNSLSAWTATSFITANSFGDRGVGVARYRNFIVGFGDYSIEFFVNAGNATGSVLQRVADATITIGARRTSSSAAPSIRVVGDSVYWIGHNKSGAHGIFRLKGMRAEKISNAAIDKMVSIGGLSGVAGGFTLLGMTHVMFSAGGTIQLCYCVETGFWWVMQPADPIVVQAIAGAVDSSNRSKSYMTGTSGSTAAKVFSFDPNTPLWQDNGSAYALAVRTSNMDMGERRRKFWHSISIIGDIQSSASSLLVLYSDNDYATTVTLGTVDMSTNVPMLKRAGSSRRRSWTLSHAANTPCRLEAMELDFTVGTN